MGAEFLVVKVGSSMLGCWLSFCLGLWVGLFAIPAEGATDENPESVAGNEQVADVLKTFKGRGAMADGSNPTEPSVAVERFEVRDGVEIELVVAEPEVEQPLALNWDSRGRLWVVQYRQYQFPAGLKIVEYDNHLRARFDKVPLPPPHGTPGKDVISVFEDSNGDGEFDLKKDVVTGLNIATSVAIGAGGIWVANPPYLLFYPDADGDDVPDTDPLVKLSGFGIEDTHSVMNSLKFGPDGWLYGADGSTTTGKVIDPATGDLVEWQGQMIWRFHPETEQFEIYAEGGGNTFSLEIDAKGHVFSGTNNGKTRGMFYPQGSYGKKSWGKHGPLTNPYAFGYFQHMNHEGDQRRFAQAFTIYESGLFKEPLAGRIVAPNSLQNVVWSSRLEREGSTYRTVDEENILESGDRWFRPVYAGVGMDGAIYMADWYDTRLSHVSPVDDWHKTSGRVYRLKPPGSEPVYELGDIAAKSPQELMALFVHPNREVRRRALLELGWSGDQQINSELVDLVNANQGQASLEALWALNLLKATSDELLTQWMSHPDQHIRRWVIRLIGDRRVAEGGLIDALVGQAKVETDVQVRVQMAASAKRLSSAVALPMIAQLTRHREDVEDLHQPLMIWWALEAHSETGRALIQQWVDQPGAWWEPLFRDVLAGRLMRRYAMAGGPLNFQSCVALVASAPDDDARDLLLEALQSAFEGDPLPELPNSLSKALEAYAGRLGESGLVVRLQSGDKSAVGEASKAIFDATLPIGLRTELIRQLGRLDERSALPPLTKVLGLDQESALKRVALQTLARFGDPKVAQSIIGRYGSSLPAEHGVRDTAEQVLASRLDWAVLMLDQVDVNVIKARDISADVVQLMQQHADETLNARIQKHWPGIAAGAGGVDLVAESARIKQILEEGEGDPTQGRVVFAARCAVCHQLFEEGGDLGPELTGYERQNLDFWIPALVNPSLELREGYLNYVASMKDGRKVSGLMMEQSLLTVTLKDAAGQISVLSRSEMDGLAASPISMMPPLLISGLSDNELRGLFAYLRK